MSGIELVSVEVTDRCAKACSFCYNHSHPAGATSWDPERLTALVTDGAARGLRAVSFGGGEPLQYAHLFDVLRALDGVVQRTMTTNGLLLERNLDALVAARPDKVHVSIHDAPTEVLRVLAQVGALEARGIPAGVNLLVRRSRRDEARAAWRMLRDGGVPAARIVLLPLRAVDDLPTPRDVAEIARDAAGAREPFQSMSCLTACGASPRFVSLDAHERVAWCSYTQTRRRIGAPTWDALLAATEGLGLAYCG